VTGAGGQESAREVAALFLRLGATAFGGPAAHVALMHTEVVERRRWVDEQEFLDLVGLTALLPGPNSTELAIAVGRRRAGWRGLGAAGLAFIVPAAVIVGVLAWCYVRWGRAPAAEDLRDGVLPVILAVVLVAGWRLGRTAVRGPLTAAVAVAALAARLAGADEIVVLVAAAAVAGVWGNRHRIRPAVAAVVPLGPLVPLPVLAAAGGQAGADAGPLRLFLLFLRIGSLLFGSGYVLLAFLEDDLVHGAGLLTSRQVLDAVAVGQVTPGPLFTTATMVGYLVDGVPGAVAATVGIFLPSFVLVAAIGPGIGRLLRSPVARPALDGLNAAALALVAAAVVDLAGEAVDGPAGGVLAAASLGVLLGTRLNPTWLVVVAGAGAIAVGAVT
jgi:chromate transporter